jgi:hypothetical protein
MVLTLRFHGEVPKVLARIESSSAGGAEGGATVVVGPVVLVVLDATVVGMAVVGAAVDVVVEPRRRDADASAAASPLGPDVRVAAGAHAAISATPTAKQITRRMRNPQVRENPCPVLSSAGSRSGLKKDLGAMAYARSGGWVVRPVAPRR